MGDPHSIPGVVKAGAGRDPWDCIVRFWPQLESAYQVAMAMDRAPRMMIRFRAQDFAFILGPVTTFPATMLCGLC